MYLHCTTIVQRYGQETCRGWQLMVQNWLLQKVDQLALSLLQQIYASGHCEQQCSKQNANRLNNSTRRLAFIGHFPRGFKEPLIFRCSCSASIQCQFQKILLDAFQVSSERSSASSLKGHCAVRCLERQLNKVPYSSRPERVALNQGHAHQIMLEVGTRFQRSNASLTNRYSGRIKIRFRRSLLVNSLNDIKYVTNNPQNIT